MKWLRLGVCLAIGAGIYLGIPRVVRADCGLVDCIRNNCGLCLGSFGLCCCRNESDGCLDTCVDCDGGNLNDVRLFVRVLYDSDHDGLGEPGSDCYVKGPGLIVPQDGLPLGCLGREIPGLSVGFQTFSGANLTFNGASVYHDRALAITREGITQPVARANDADGTSYNSVNDTFRLAYLYGLPAEYRVVRQWGWCGRDDRCDSDDGPWVDSGRVIYNFLIDEVGPAITPTPPITPPPVTNTPTLSPPVTPTLTPTPPTPPLTITPTIPVPTLSPTPGYAPWWQSNGGDVGANGSGNGTKVTSRMPSGEELSLASTAVMDAGMLPYNGGNLELGLGQWSARGPGDWTVFSEYDTGFREDFTLFREWFNLPDPFTWTDNIAGKPTAVSTVSSVPWVFAHNGDLTLNDWEDPDVLATDPDYIIFVNHDLNVRAPEFTVEPGGFIMFIVSGDITFESSSRVAQGIYVADGKLVVADSGGNNDFEGGGMFIGWDGVEFERDLTNNANPAEKMIYRPDLLLNAPEDLRFPVFNWSEKPPNKVNPAGALEF